jgi:hypothetical protein
LVAFFTATQTLVWNSLLAPITGTILTNGEHKIHHFKNNVPRWTKYSEMDQKKKKYKD